jgi:hypothetical protein
MCCHDPHRAITIDPKLKEILVNFTSLNDYTKLINNEIVYIFANCEDEEIKAQDIPNPMPQFAVDLRYF